MFAKVFSWLVTPCILRSGFAGYTVDSRLYALDCGYRLRVLGYTVYGLRYTRYDTRLVWFAVYTVCPAHTFYAQLRLRLRLDFTVICLVYARLYAPFGLRAFAGLVTLISRITLRLRCCVLRLRLACGLRCCLRFDCLTFTHFTVYVLRNLRGVALPSYQLIRLRLPRVILRTAFTFCYVVGAPRILPRLR